MNIETVEEILGDAGGVWDTVRNVFDYMSICEETIAWAQFKYPDKEHWLFSCFTTLYPFTTPACETMELYKAHCIEVLERVANNNPVQDATKAEVITILNEASIKAPLLQDPCTLYYNLFVDVYGTQAIDMFKKSDSIDEYWQGPHETWVGACDELQDSISRRIENHRTINYPDHLNMKDKDMPQPANLEVIAKALRKLDIGLRKKSICEDCGKPESGFLPQVSENYVGEVTGQRYPGGTILRPEDAGLCCCDRTETV